MDRKIRVGLVGTGWIAESYGAAYKRCPDVEIAGMSDIVPGKAEHFCKKWEISTARCYEDYREMLEKEHLDIVSVCTGNTLHKTITVDVLESGCHVICEKPMCVTLDEAVAMCRAEKKSGKKLFVGVQPRMDKNMQMIKKIVDSGELGRIYYLQAGGGRRHGIPTPFGTSFIQKKTAGIGALGDIGCYSLDMLLNAVGYPKPVTVSGYRSDFFGKRPSYYPEHPEYAEVFSVDDFAAAFVRLEGGIILDFRISWAMHMDTAGDALILGTEGGLKIPSTECWNGSTGGPLKVYKDVAGVQTEYILSPEKSEMKELFYQKVRMFLDAIKCGGEAPIPSREMLYNQAIIDGIVRSAEAGREIAVEIPEL